MARRKEFRELKTTILLVVEGYTELIYFNQLKEDHHLSNITIEPKISPRKDPVNIVERAMLEQSRKDFDYIWCVFDLDTINENEQGYKTAVSDAKKNNIQLAESLPCFEIWYLLHFVFTTREFQNDKQVCKELCRHIKEYCKEQKYLKQKNLYSFLEDKIPTAINNCMKLEAFNKKENTSGGTKCDIYKIIRQIEDILE